MMINKRLINEIAESRKYIYLNVLFQWIGLFSTIIFMFVIKDIIHLIYINEITKSKVYLYTIVLLIVITVRALSIIGATRMGYYSAKNVKKTLRKLIFEKIVRIGKTYQNSVSTSEVVQMSIEGVDQLEVYFGSYLPQFFYALIAPLTLFAFLVFVDFQSALILLFFVPMIPISIVIIQKIAKRLLAKYWGKYTQLGGDFLENIQGLTTLKIYQSDEYKQKEMNARSEEFRRITMKVLLMQLNSISVMDIVAYGGAALGMISAFYQLKNGYIELTNAVLIILLSADFFIPMRQLGSYFHIAMNGMAAADKIFGVLDLPERSEGVNSVSYCRGELSIEQLSYVYDETKLILSEFSTKFCPGKLNAIIGESGSGKTTLALILSGNLQKYTGSVKLDGLELSDIELNSISNHINYISFEASVFKGTVKDNLLIANPNAQDIELIEVLRKVQLDEFFDNDKGLDKQILERGSNLSGGQKQRLSLARALLKKSAIYIFDEVTSNIDVESEIIITDLIYELSRIKTVIFITHRMANVVKADFVFLLGKGKLLEFGKHDNLLKNNLIYASMWNQQNQIEQYQSKMENI